MAIMERYVCYYRVSTNKQSLGLDAQRNICNEFAKDAEVIAEFSEHESGKNCTRPELEKAVALCQKEKAVLLVAKLDRLTRDLAFGAALKKSGVEFKALDCPELTPLMLGVMLGLAQQERELISARTRLALDALKLRGKKLGKAENLSMDGRILGASQTRKKAIEDPSNKKAWALCKALLSSGKSRAQIVRELNKEGFLTPRGAQWTQRGLQNLIDRMKETEANMKVNEATNRLSQG